MKHSLYKTTDNCVLVMNKNIHIASNSNVMQVVYKGEGNIFTVQWSTEIGVTSFLPKQRQVQWKGAVGQLLYIIYAVTSTCH